MMDIKFTKHSVKSEELLVSDTFEFQMEETAQIHCKNEVKRININKLNRINQKSSLGGVKNNDYDVEKLKKEILKKS